MKLNNLRKQRSSSPRRKRMKTLKTRTLIKTMMKTTELMT